MARSGVPGIDLPEYDDPNHRTDPCGCTFVRYAYPVNGWVYLKKCDDHRASLSGEGR